jgi:hypothetical protein
VAKKKKFYNIGTWCDGEWYPATDGQPPFPPPVGVVRFVWRWLRELLLSDEGCGDETGDLKTQVVPTFSPFSPGASCGWI